MICLHLDECGYVGVYYVGVCSCLLQFYPGHISEIKASSIGAVAAACSLSGVACGKFWQRQKKALVRKLQYKITKQKFSPSQERHIIYRSCR